MISAVCATLASCTSCISEGQFSVSNGEGAACTTCVQLAGARKRLASCFCVFQTRGRCLSSTGPNSEDPFILDPFRRAPSYCFIFTPFLFLSHRAGTISITLSFVLSALPRAPKAKRETDLIPVLSVFLHKSFKREEKYVTLRLWLRGINYVQHIQA